jgi:hypothetical protein
MTVRYSMQIGEAKSICGTHVDPRIKSSRSHYKILADLTEIL